MHAQNLMCLKSNEKEEEEERQEEVEEEASIINAAKTEKNN